jgi:homocysteine S-methyltransferase
MARVLNPLAPFLADNGVMVLDGALATELERRGADLRDPLWSAKLLLEDPAMIRRLHYDYYVAGADVATTASYQASFAGFAARDLDTDAAADLMRLSVTLACEARAEFWAVPEHRVGRLRPLVAASVGPYGAALADGSEYRGDYGLTVEELMAWHRPRLAVLAAAGADLLACETIPSAVEAEALVRLLAERPSSAAWLSFSCRDETRISDGTPLAAVIELGEACDQVVALGINCTAPPLIEPLLDSIRDRTRKPLLVYPNRGETWDAVARCWVAGTGAGDLAAAAIKWATAGARLIGGCCRTTPEDIRRIAAALRPVTT